MEKLIESDAMLNKRRESIENKIENELSVISRPGDEGIKLKVS